MRVAFFVACFVILSCIAPSQQYGTMFTDNITPAFEDETFFIGIRTFEAFSTSATIGKIAADNVIGFSINTPGPITSVSSDLTFIASQGIEFGSGSSVVNIGAAGDLSLTAQRIDFDAGNIDFEGDGNVSLGGLESRIRANSFAITTTDDITFESTGAILDIHAPVSISSSSSGDSHFHANNNVEIISQSGAVTFESSEDLLLQANYFDIDGQLSFDAATSSMSVTAASIVEFASVSVAKNTFEDMNVVVSSGDIVLSAAGVLSLTNQADSSTMIFSADRNNFVVSRSASESIIQFQTDSDFKITATNQVTFANFDENTDITFTGQDDITMEAPDVSVTTSYGRITARNDLTADSTGNMFFEVTNQDLKASAITGNIEILSKQGDFTLNTEDNFVTHSREAYIDTKSSMTFNASDISLRQNDINADGGSLRLEIGNSFDITTTNIEFDTSGKLDFTMADDVIVNAGAIEIQAAKAFDDILFSTGDTVTISTDDEIHYSSSLFTLSTNRYLATSGNGFSVNTRNAASVLVGDTTTVNSDGLIVNSSFGAIDIDAEDSITFVSTDFNHKSFEIEFDVRNTLTIVADSVAEFDVGSSLSAEIENQLSVQSLTIELSAENTVQFIQDLFDLDSDSVSFTANKAIYMSQNLPDDELRFSNIDEFTATGDFVDFKAGGSITATSTSFTTSGDGTLFIDGYNSVVMSSDEFIVDANGIINIASGGALTMNSDGTTDFIAGSFLTIDGPQGANGLTKFESSNFVDIFADDIDFLATDITFTASTDFAAVFLDDIDFFGISENQFAFGKFSVHADNDLELFTSRIFESVSELGTFFFAGDNLEVLSQTVINLSANTATEISAPVWELLSSDDIDIFTQFEDGLITWEGRKFVLDADDDLSFDADDHFSLYSGDNLIFNVNEDITLTSDELFIDGSVSTNFEGDSIAVTADDNVELLAGGETSFTLAGATTSASGTETEFEAATFVFKSGPADWDITGDLLSHNYDGVTSYWALQFGSFDAGIDIAYTAAGSVFVDGNGVRFTANGNDGTDLSMSGTSELPEGNIIFQSINNNVQSTVIGEFFYETSQFAEMIAFESISFDSETELSVTAFGDFDYTSESHTEAVVGGDLKFVAAGTGNFQSGNSISFIGKEDFSFVADEGNFLVSTGEQGALLIDSDENFAAISTTFQSWKASGDFDVSADNSASFNTVTGGISLFTTGGAVTFEVDGGPMVTTYLGDLDYTSGDLLAFRSSRRPAEGLQIWNTLGSFSATADQGNIVLSADDNDFEFTAQNSLRVQATGARNPTDGIDIFAGSTLTFQTDVNEATALAVNPLNDLVFGDITRPDVTFIAGGSPTQTGVTITSDGNIETFSHDDTVYAAVGQFQSTIGRDTLVTSNDDFTVEGIETFSVLSDAGNVHFHGEGVDINGSGPFTATATGGPLEIISDSDEGLATIQASGEVLFSANLFRADVGPFTASATNIIHDITKSSTFKTTVGGGGSIDFSTNVNDITITSAGSFTAQTIGHDGSILVQGGDLELITQTSGDISLFAAGSMDLDFVGDTTFSSGSAFSVDSNSNRGEDLTRGDIGFFGKGTLAATSGDTFTFSAGRDLSISSDGTTTLDTTGDVTFKATDDIIARFTAVDGTSETLLFENTDGRSGDVFFITESLLDVVTFDIGDDINWNLGENVIGYSLGDVLFTTTNENTKDEAIVISTTAQDADLIFGAAKGNLQFSAADDFNINTNTDASGVLRVVSFNDVDFTTTNGDITFTSESEQIELISMFGSTDINSASSVQFYGVGDSGRLEILADGISEESHEAIHALGATGVLVAAPLGTVSVDAYESIEFHANQDPNNIIVGFVPEIVAGVLTEPTGATTSLLATGANADIIFNLREPQNGIGSLNIIAGNNGLPLGDPFDPAGTDVPSAVDFVASDSILFENESGYAFQGILDVPRLDRPADVFFTANGEFAGIELSTGARAALADIEINASAGIFDSDGKMSLRSKGESGSTTRVESVDGTVHVAVQSTDVEDSIEISAYRGEIEISASQGDLVFVAETGTSMNFIGRKGIHFDSTTLTATFEDEINFSGSDGNMEFTGNTIDLLAEDILVIAQEDIILESIGDMQIDGSNIFVYSSGNIHFLFGDLMDFTEVQDIIFSNRNSLSIPMRENTVTVGSICPTQGEFIIAHNNQYYIPPNYETSGFSNVKDTGVWVCYCNDVWSCRQMSTAPLY